MERNYQKEYALAIKKVAELQELVFAYQSMLDDKQIELNKYTEADNENTELVEVK